MDFFFGIEMNIKLTGQIHSNLVDQKLRFIVVNIANINRKIQISAEWRYPLIICFNTNLKPSRVLKVG